MSRVGGGVRATGHARALLVELAAKLSDNFNLGSGQATPAHPPLLLFYLYFHWILAQCDGWHLTGLVVVRA